MRPVYPQPGYVAQDLHDLLATQQFIYAECFTITPKAGSPLRYTTAQQDVSVVPIIGGPGRVIYKAKEVLIEGLRFKTGIGVEVDEQAIEIAYGDGAIYQAALTFPEALKQGRLDGATITRDRFFASAWGAPWIAGTPMFSGRVSTLSSVGRQSATVNVKSDLVLLNVQTPKHLWVPNCKNSWGDPGCGLTQSNFSVQAQVGSGSTRTVIPWTGVTNEFVMGKVYIEGGDNVTRIRTILKVTAGVSLELIYPLDFDPSTGQNFVAFPNCRREFSRCSLYHADPEQRFLGFPHIPVAETAS